MGASQNVVSVFKGEWAGWAFLSAFGCPPTRIVIHWQNIMDKFCQVDSEMVALVDGQFMSAPINVLGGGGRPAVLLLDILEKRWAVGGVSDGGLLIVSDNAVVDVELGAGMREHQYLGAIASMLFLEVTGGRIGINVELSGKGQGAIPTMDLKGAEDFVMSTNEEDAGDNQSSEETDDHQDEPSSSNMG